jgi:peptide deformylase
MNIVQTPNDILNKKAEPVQKVDGKLKAIIREMKQTLRESGIGVGLAAPQVGISLQLFVASDILPEAKNKEQVPILVCINPRIVSKQKVIGIQSSVVGKKTENRKPKTDNQLEGCLSILHIWGPVKRSEKITLEYMDEHGRKHTKTFTGFMATIIQHEIDHLNGVLFTQRVLEQGKNLYREVPGQKKFEEIEV